MNPRTADRMLEIPVGRRHDTHIHDQRATTGMGV